MIQAYLDLYNNLNRRPFKNEWLMAMACTASKRSECIRRDVGAVIVDEYSNILSTGYNGMVPGGTSCKEKPCGGASCKSGKGLNKCEASHAEQSALVRLTAPKEAKTIYVTAEPCVACTKMLLLTGVHTIYYLEPYPTSGSDLWLNDKRKSISMWIEI